MISKLAAKIFNWFREQHRKHCNHTFSAPNTISYSTRQNLTCSKCGFTPCSHEEI